MRESRRVAAALAQVRDSVAKLGGKQQPAIATGDSLVTTSNRLAGPDWRTQSGEYRILKGRTADMQPPTPAQGTGDETIASIQAANARFWASRR